MNNVELTQHLKSDGSLLSDAVRELCLLKCATRDFAVPVWGLSPGDKPRSLMSSLSLRDTGDSTNSRTQTHRTIAAEGERSHAFHVTQNDTAHAQR